MSDRIKKINNYICCKILTNNPTVYVEYCRILPIDIEHEYENFQFSSDFGSEINKYKKSLKESYEITDIKIYYKTTEWSYELEPIHNYFINQEEITIKTTEN